MPITVKTIGSFVKVLGFSEKMLEVPSNTTVAGLLAMLALDSTRPRIITCNGRAVPDDAPLKAGDRLAIAPIYSGG
jgi:sulfur carrier protein ThiS